jgi:hypothetical protein
LRLPKLRLGRSPFIFVVFFTASLLFLFFGPYQNFAPKGFLDTWIHTGYFTNFSCLFRHYGITYYVSRLPWIIPGAIALKLAAPATATVILNAPIVCTSLIHLLALPVGATTLPLLHPPFQRWSTTAIPPI